jgi:hypothetical protein
MKNTEIVIQFIPIIVIFMLLRFSKQFVSFSFTVLGKLLALMIIIFYSSVDLVFGLCICGLVILYYQSDYVENMLNLDDSIIVNDIVKLDFDEITTSEELNYDVDNIQDDIIQDDGLFLVPTSNYNIKKTNKSNKIQEKKCKKTKCNQVTCENMDNYSSRFDEQIKSDLISQFKTKNCIKGELKYKDMTVKNDMTEHVFSELAFENQPCNPCSITCNYSIIEEKLKTEEKMLPISTTQ